MATYNYIRFVGKLYPNMEFEFKPGWETDKVSHMPHANQDEKEGYRISLLDEKGAEIVGFSPDINFQTSCAPNGNKKSYARVVGYLPLNNKGVEVVFKKGDYLIYSRPLAKQSPQVTISEFEVKDTTISIAWKSEASTNTPLTYNLVYVVDKKRFFTLALNYEEQAGKFDISTFPGSKTAHVAVLATDGLRSGFTISKPFSTPEKPSDVFILKPGPGEVFNFGQDISFCGRAHDIAGASLPKENLVWKLNEKEIAKGVQIGVIDTPPSGSYVLSLEAKVGSKTIAKKELKFTVKKIEKHQQRYFELLKDIDGGK